MSCSKQKQRLKHCQSEGSLRKHLRDRSLPKRASGRAEGEQPNPRIQNKKYGLSRFATESNEKSYSKDYASKYMQLFASQSSGRIEEKPTKLQKMRKNESSTTFRRADHKKHYTPLVSKFIAKTEMTEYEPLAKPSQRQRKPLKKERLKKELTFKKSPSRQIQSLFIDKAEGKGKKYQMSREGQKPNKSIGKGKRKCDKLSLQSTPSCLLGEQIQFLEQMDEGTFGKVFRGRWRKSGQIVAVKKVPQDSRYRNRQLQMVGMLKNEFIVEMVGSFLTQEGGQECLNIAMAYYEENLFHRITHYRRTTLNFLEAKIILYQLFKGLSYLHSLDICHRDIKPENILLRGASAVICDFGSAKLLQPGHPNISYICARCYRAPELIFGATHYSTAVDIWSAGCVILELLKGEPLFIGETSLAHLQEIMLVMGRPTEQEVIAMNPDFAVNEYRFPSSLTRRTEWIQIFPHVDEALLDLIATIMVYDPAKRARSADILAHGYFDELRDKPTYDHLRSQYRLKDFFNFSEQELQVAPHLKAALVPLWYRQERS